jgi:hypothetical protein
METSIRGSVKKRLEIDMTRGILSGVVIKDGDDRKGVILVFMREDDL